MPGQQLPQQIDRVVIRLRRIGRVLPQRQQLPPRPEILAVVAGRHAALPQLAFDALQADLVELVERHERRAVHLRRNAGGVQQPAQDAPVVQLQREVVETEPGQHVGHRRAQFRFHHHRS